MTSFADALALRAVELGAAEGDRYTAETMPDWGQGRAALGGLVAGWGLRALAGRVDPSRSLRSVQVSFVGPVAPGTAEVVSRVLRTGRALTCGEARISQGGEDCAVVLAVYGASRPTNLVWPAPPMLPAPSPDSIDPMVYQEGVTPVFTRHLDYRWATKFMHFSGGDQPEVGGWIRIHDSGPLDAAGMLSLLDAWPAPILTLLHRQAPASTVTWMVNLLAAPPPEGWPELGWWRFHGSTVAAGDGYADITGRLWGPDGNLVATSRQLVAEFSGR